MTTLIMYDAKCFLCGADAACGETDRQNRRLYRCPTCRDYEISVTAMGKVRDDAFKAAASSAAAKVTDPVKIFEIIFDLPSGQIVQAVVTRRPEIR
jgi:hypothetical protein